LLSLSSLIRTNKLCCLWVSAVSFLGEVFSIPPYKHVISNPYPSLIPTWLQERMNQSKGLKESKMEAGMAQFSHDFS
jgi:hypothetical protein